MSGASDVTDAEDRRAETTATTIAGQPRVQLVALVVVLGALVPTAGRTGVAIWLLTLLTWVVLGTPFAVAAGFVALAATPSVSLAPSFEPDLAWLAPLAYLGLAATDVAETAHPRTTALTTVVAATLLGGAGWFLLAATTLPSWAAGLTVLVLVALGSYALVVYGRLAFDPEEPIDDRNTDERSSDVARADGGSDRRETRDDRERNRQHRQHQSTASHPHSRP